METDSKRIIFLCLCKKIRLIIRDFVFSGSLKQYVDKFVNYLCGFCVNKADKLYIFQAALWINLGIRCDLYTMMFKIMRLYQGSLKNH
ncbi:hypothetical protein [Wielerella bovis]|uniref:hypothetical protein n=1 Tax=Wielerella bovis TaxID=2917790 RepID=UPI0020190C2B|nr:hypothetical protein [Wielerella bovis]MCG7656096.1 hypothetical protein [Wielerella bovis]